MLETNQRENIVKIPLIIPVYNAEDHVHQCFDTVHSQTIKDLEVICVDDGSTDHSKEVLKEYQKRIQGSAECRCWSSKKCRATGGKRPIY